MQTYSKQEAREHVSRLVESFQKVEATLDKVPEAQIENDYIRPLFRYLNWRTEGADLRMSEREVVLVETDRQRKRPDYRFQLNGQHLFFMDAKRVKYSMYNPRWQWQVYRYAYSTRNNPAPRKVDFGVLTDFQEFILLDCTFEAKEPEAVNNFRVLDWRYPDYVSQFDRLWDIFERNNVLAASGDRKCGLWACYLTPKQAKANRVAPDEGFLDKLDNDKNGWRVRLAKDMKKCSPDLTGEVITAAVQLLIDRLVFIKALSDRDIDDDYLAKLAECIEANGLEQRNQGWFGAAKPLFDRLKRFYNGSMFAPRPELEAVVTSNRVVRDIIRELDPNHSPYDFSVLPVEILGTIYERFLGKVVRTTEQRVKIEDKPEVRKAGGVYYTPQYIVRYIVEQTVGKLLADCKTPDDVARLKILDPACGSGSFLIGAYDALIEWHKSYYAAKAKPDRKAAYRDADGDIRLAAKLKRQILLNNIFGVDIDQQAVEVTRFSLSLKALEDTRKDELDEERNLFKETVLPDLKDNIVCGNSLIGTDILEGQLFDLEEERKLNPMDYDKKFPAIMGSGGFDVIVGNPPYVFTRETMTVREREYYSSRYALSWEKQNTFMLFMERLLRLLKPNGTGSFIVPNSWLTIESAKLLRQSYLRYLSRVVDLNYPAFYGVSMEPCIFIVRGNESTAAVELARIIEHHQLGSAKCQLAERAGLQRHNRIVFHASTEVGQLVERIIAVSKPMRTLFDVRTGLQAYERGKGNPPQTAVDVKNHVFDRHRRENKDSIRYLEGRDVERYAIHWSGLWMQYGPWLSQPREVGIFTRPRVLLREITGPLPYCLHYAYVEEQYLNNKSVLNILDYQDHCANLKALIGVLNSRLVSFYYKQQAVKSGRKIFPKVVIKDLGCFPVPEHLVKHEHSELVAKVEQMMAAKQAWAAAQTEKDKTYYDDKCKALDKQIDALVYELYDLTAKEIAIVEEKRC